MQAAAMEATATGAAVASAATTAVAAGADWRSVAITILGGVLVAIVNGFFSLQREKARNSQG